MRPHRVVALVIGSLFALASVILLAAGGALVGIHATQRDGDGFYSSGDRSFRTSSYALTSEAIDLHLDLRDADLGVLDDIGTVRIDVRSGHERAVFVGIGPTDAVDEYLAGTAHDEVVGIGHRDEPTYRRSPGEARPPAPGNEDLWVASATGGGAQSLTWDVRSGEWTVVVMNGDASAGIEVTGSVGVKTGVLLPIGLALFVGALVAGALAGAGLVFALRRPGPIGPVTGSTTAIASSSYPVRLRGELDPSLSRWRWLVKWFLALPHLLVLALLWPIAAVLTVGAGFAILFTGRYPAPIFDFNVGVMRWTWRVTFYAFTFGTDRYPPFSLDRDSTYPADLEVDRPATLSRGLVLVKWWLLAIPHYLVLAVFGSGFAWWGWGWGADGDGRVVGGAGLVGVLVFISGVTLLVTRRYPQSIFDFVMGMQRWTYRVFTYAALMRDEYPPFRLDPGGRDPGSVVASDVPDVPDVPTSTT